VAWPGVTLEDRFSFKNRLSLRNGGDRSRTTRMNNPWRHHRRSSFAAALEHGARLIEWGLVFPNRTLNKLAASASVDCAAALEQDASDRKSLWESSGHDGLMRSAAIPVARAAAGGAAAAPSQLAIANSSTVSSQRARDSGPTATHGAVDDAATPAAAAGNNEDFATMRSQLRAWARRTTSQAQARVDR
jgi:hypothetical protein